MAHFKKAAELTTTEAYYNIGVLYDNGLGVDMDKKLAADFYLKAAQNNLPVAQNSLGYLYDNGLGVEQNYEKAIQWYKKSVDGGYEKAKDRMESLKCLGYSG